MSVPFYMDGKWDLQYEYTPPRAALDVFLPLGAVKCSMFINEYKHGVPLVFGFSIYFWSAQGQEIGSWSNIVHAAEILPGPPRVWAQEYLERQLYFDLPAPGCATGAALSLNPSEADPCFISAVT